MPRKQPVAGFAIGILAIDIWYPLVPGNIVNATTYDFPVVYKILQGATIEQILSGDPALLPLVFEAGQELINQGVRAIVGACGSFAYYQKEAANAFQVPTYLSTILQVPLILQGLIAGQKLGILCASEAALNQRVFEQCGITDLSRLQIFGAMHLPEFQRLARCEGQFNSAKLELELVDLVKERVGNNPEIGALLIQCSDMPPYASAIQNAIQKPVFDMTTLIEWVYKGVVRKPFRGYI